MIKLGDEVLLNAFSDKGLKVRGVPLVGIYEYVVPTQALEVVSFVDVQTMRALNAMTFSRSAASSLRLRSMNALSFSANSLPKYTL